MSVSTYVTQMVRVHYGGDERLFAHAAQTLAQHAKSYQLRREIQALVTTGVRRTLAPRPYAPPAAKPADHAPASGLLYALPEIAFPELQLDPFLQSQLDEIVVELEYRTDLAERGLRARNRLLFHGPPGNGKTSVAAAMANSLGARAYCVSVPDVVNMYVGAASQNVAKVFADIRDGMVVVFDELDSVGSERGGGTSSASKEANTVVNTLLMLLDRHKAGIIIATTNRPDIIDPALRRRFDEQILFPPPSLEQLRALAGKLEEKHRLPHPVHVDDCANFDEVAKRVTTEARRQVMAELLSADESEETEGGNDGNETKH